MLFTDTLFVGIDPTAGIKPFVYTAIDKDLNVVVMSEGTIDEALAFVASQRSAIIAVCSPRNPNIGLMDDDQIRQNLTPIPKPGRWINFRVADYLLRIKNIRIPQTSANADECPKWMQMGFTFYQRLVELGYKSYHPEDTDRAYIEVYPHACYCSLLGILPLKKTTLEGRIQRQLVLFENFMNIPDPMRMFEEITRYRLLKGILPTEDLYSQGELDALVAAYTARVLAVNPSDTTLVGHPDEGQVVIPVSPLKEQYS